MVFSCKKNLLLSAFILTAAAISTWHLLVPSINAYRLKNAILKHDAATCKAICPDYRFRKVSSTDWNSSLDEPGKLFMVDSVMGVMANTCVTDEYGACEVEPFSFLSLMRGEKKVILRVYRPAYPRDGVTPYYTMEFPCTVRAWPTRWELVNRL